MRKRIFAIIAGTALSLGVTAQNADPNAVRAEKMFGFVLANQADSLYANMSAQVVQMVTKDKLDGVLAQAEAMAGKYMSHGEWEQQTVMGQKAYVSVVKFERMELGALIVFDSTGKMLGIQLVPVDAIKKK